MSLLFRCLRALDEHVNVKVLLRVWGPRLEFTVRLLLAATFLDDSLRLSSHFAEHTKQVAEQGYLAPLAASSPGVVAVMATVILGVGLLAQSLGSLCLLALVQPDGATEALIAWVIAQPFLYAQLANVEFVAESFSLVGGLLILRAHLAEKANRDGRTVPLGGGLLCAADGTACAPEGPGIARTQLIGRLLLPAVYLYHALYLLSNIFHHSLSMFVVNAAIFAGLALGCTLVAAGLRSRTVALVLALVNLCAVCYQHPFFRFVWREGGEWQFNEREMRRSFPHVRMPKGILGEDFTPWQIFDLHRYYFFQGLSTTGALLLLAQFGPGEIAVEEDEVLIGDVQRARDYK